MLLAHCGPAGRYQCNTAVGYRHSDIDWARRRALDNDIKVPTCKSLPHGHVTYIDIRRRYCGDKTAIHIGWYIKTCRSAPAQWWVAPPAIGSKRSILGCTCSTIEYHRINRECSNARDHCWLNPRLSIVRPVILRG